MINLLCTSTPFCLCLMHDSRMQRVRNKMFHVFIKLSSCSRSPYTRQISFFTTPTCFKLFGFTSFPFWTRNNMHLVITNRGTHMLIQTSLMTRDISQYFLLILKVELRWFVCYKRSCYSMPKRFLLFSALFSCNYIPNSLLFYQLFHVKSKWKCSGLCPHSAAEH